jgi:rubrerythrin
MYNGLDEEVSAEAAASLRDAGARGQRFDYRCASCGYGIVVKHLPPSCPMCGETRWELAASRPFTSLADDYVA